MTRQTEDSTNSKVFHGPFHCSGSEQYLNECRHNPLPLEGCINTVTLSCTGETDYVFLFTWSLWVNDTDGINSSQEKKWSPIVAGTLLSLLLVATTVTIVILWQKRRTFKRKEMETNILAMYVWLTNWNYFLYNLQLVKVYLGLSMISKSLIISSQSTIWARVRPAWFSITSTLVAVTSAQSRAVTSQCLTYT